jgi:hypothetical protein
MDDNSYQAPKSTTSPQICHSKGSAETDPGSFQHSKAQTTTQKNKPPASQKDAASQTIQTASCGRYDYGRLY